MKRPKHFLYILASLSGLAIMYVCVSVIPFRQIFPLINADSMFFQVLYQDLIIDGNTLRGWDLNTTFNLFPNSFLYLISFLISKNPFINTLIHGLLQYSLFFLVLFYFYRSFRPFIPTKWHVPGILMLNLFFFDAMMAGDYYYATLFVHPYHFGAFITFFLLGALNLRHIRTPQKNKVVWILIIAALGVFSNRIVVIMFTIPWIIVLCVAMIKKWLPASIAVRGIVINFAGALLGIALYVLIKNLGIVTFASTKLFSWDNILPSITALFQTYGKLFSQSIPMTLMLGFSALFFVVNFIWCIRDIFNYNHSSSPNHNENHAIQIWMLTSLIFTVVIFFAPAINGMFFGPASVRYNFFVLLLPFINISILGYSVWGNKPISNTIINWVAPSLIVLVLALAVYFSGSFPMQQHFSEKKEYYPFRAKELDKLSQEVELKNGISIYWDAKPTTLYSREGIRVRQVYDDLSLYPLAIARSWYYPQTDSQEAPVFNFIIYHKSMKDESIETIFGENITRIKRDDMEILLVPDFTYTSSRRIVLLSNLDE
ncbi:MAG: hypothetical protein EA361_16840 [Bacteroidetes bacterium]|nr:MAG: hypothetical protein EA361_16840 [Bacteroidota bacterium]